MSAPPQSAEPEPSEPSRFPEARRADPDGLVAVGGKLDPEWLLDAYRHGVFPWPSGAAEPMLWWSPDPRAILPLDGMRISKRLARTIRSGRFEVTCDQDFAGVLEGCATAPGRKGATWLTEEMRVAYQKMHELGYAHSIEAWGVANGDRQLAGGVYGLAIGALFAAESMFHYETDASKVALAGLVSHLNARGYAMLDIQQWTDHTGSLGAVEIPREEYLHAMSAAIAERVTFGSEIEG